MEMQTRHGDCSTDSFVGLYSAACCGSVRIVIVLSVRLTTTCEPSFVAYSGGRGASFLGRMDPERVRRWSLRAAAFADSDSAKKTPDRRNAAAI
ncbi:hypothetical protein T01_10464 [Trichinella spiralis]|uniref:Uncharacterized protein n=1 Tax=Trichinella spiralis TaxID=6334 RepID=A0A0V1C105_TRISP|nr:hypothetical protein T01_10464 [Trichinella spiralis]